VITNERPQGNEWNVKSYARPKGTAAMLLQEELARARMRESQRVAAESRIARRLSSARRWERLAHWTSRRAARAASLQVN
jgi:hypothetical protein